MNALQTVTYFEDSKRMQLEELLNKMCAIGVPSLTKMKNGWWCRIKMHVSSAGVEFSVDSECNHQTPILAARECIDRAIAVIKQWE